MQNRNIYDKIVLVIKPTLPDITFLDAYSPTGYACGQDRRRNRREKERHQQKNPKRK